MEKTRSKAAGAKKSGTQKKSSKSQSVTSLQEFFLEELKDIYWAEKHLTKALPKLQKASTSQELAEAFAQHLEVTENHVKRLEQVFEIFGEKPRSKKCDGMEGIVKEGEDVVQETEKNTSTRDAALIMAAQKAEHYEITTYGSLVQLAKTLGQDEVSELLEQTLEEEKEADKLLSELAVNNINAMAEQESQEGEEEKENEEEME